MRTVGISYPLIYLEYPPKVDAGILVTPNEINTLYITICLHQRGLCCLKFSCSH